MCVSVCVCVVVVALGEFDGDGGGGCGGGPAQCIHIVMLTKLLSSLARVQPGSAAYGSRDSSVPLSVTIDVLGLFRLACSRAE
jgi:hypothetical protein|eukprot:m.125612 g.125612  ORF g.125612 m.125612 type:complete len:83 (-) comp22142_c0_seq2:339-587(-)